MRQGSRSRANQVLDNMKHLRGVEITEEHLHRKDSPDLVLPKRVACVLFKSENPSAMMVLYLVGITVKQLCW